MGAAEKAVLKYWEKAPPLAALAVASLAGIEIDAKADPKFTKDTLPLLTLPGGEELEGLTPILRYLGRVKDPLYGGSVLASIEVDQWLQFAPHLVTGGGLAPACMTVNEALSLRTFLVGYSLTIADIAVWAQLQITLQWDKMRRAGGLPHLARWFELVTGDPLLTRVAEAHGPKKPSSRVEFRKEQAAAGMGGGDTGSFKINLRNVAKGKVKTRFPPEPSGYLHIGHAKAAMLNHHIATLNGGQMAIRFDDTNPAKESMEFVESILADVERLGLQYMKPITYTSDYFPQMLDLAERLVRAGHMYADDTPVEQMRAERMDGIESARRNRPAEETLAVWKEMVAGSPEGRRHCMRFRIDMQDPNKAMRDPVAYRCNEAHHWRTGTKYKVYPTYDCACPFVDALEGVTHALRTSEYRDREAQFFWVLKAQQQVWPGLPDVDIWDYSRLNLARTVLSKRKLTWFVESKHVEGWDDPRMPTVQGVFRRGLQLEALREFIISQGASKNVTLQEWDKLWALNKKIIDPVCPRHTAVAAEGRVRMRLNNGPEQPEVVSVPKHKKHPPAGVKATTRTKDIWLEQEDAQAIAEGEEVTLMDWGNAIVQRVSRGEDGAVSSMEGVLHLEGNVKATKLKLTWLPDTPDLVPLRLVDFDHLITKRKMEEEDRIEDLVTPNSRWEVEALGDANMRGLQRGDVLQLERKGYFIVDRPLIRPGHPIVLFATPDGHQRKQPALQASAAAAAAAAVVAAPAAASAAAKGSTAVAPKQAAAPEQAAAAAAAAAMLAVPAAAAARGTAAAAPEQVTVPDQAAAGMATAADDGAAAAAPPRALQQKASFRVPPTPHNSCMLPELEDPPGAAAAANHAATATVLLGKGVPSSMPSATRLPATPQNSAALPATLQNSAALPATPQNSAALPAHLP